MTRSDSTVFVTRLDQDMTLTRLDKILDDSHSTLTRRACDSDSTKMTRTHQWLEVEQQGYQRWATATLLVASLPLFGKFNSGATAPVTG